MVVDALGMLFELLCDGRPQPVKLLVHGRRTVSPLRAHP